MHMSQASQAQLMVMIDEAMKSQNSFGDEEEEEFSEHDSEHHDSFDDSKYDELIKERDELLARVTELEETVASSSKSNTNDDRVREKAERARSRELERLKEAKNTLSRREITFQETIRNLEFKLEEASGRLDVQKKQAETSLKRSKLDNQAMADELDVMRTKLANMGKLEAQITKYKRKVENVDEIRDQMQELETQNQEYLDKMLNMEADLETIPVLKKQIEEKQSQLVKQSSSLTKLEMDVLSKEEELNNFRRKYEVSESKLRDALKRANLAESSTSSPFSSGDIDVDDVGEGMKLSGKDREKIARLEKKNKRLEKEIEELRRRGDGEDNNNNNNNNNEKDSTTKSSSSTEELLRRENQTLKSEMSSRLREKLELQNKLEEMQEKMNVASKESGEVRDPKEIANLRSQTLALKERLKEKQRSLEKKSVEQAKLENYVKQALAHANKTVKQSQMKYKNSLRMLKSQIEAKQKEITYFAGMLEKSKAAHKREKEMLMSSIYKIGLDLNSRLLRNEAIGVKSDPVRPKSWLGRRRAERRR